LYLQVRNNQKSRLNIRNLKSVQVRSDGDIFFNTGEIHKFLSLGVGLFDEVSVLKFETGIGLEGYGITGSTDQWWRESHHQTPIPLLFENVCIWVRV